MRCPESRPAPRLRAERSGMWNRIEKEGRLLLMALAGLALPGPAAATSPSHVIWLNHFELLPAQAELTTSQSNP
jgi:hypothetical protein